MIDAAEACFYEDGITASGVDAIAARAEVSKRTLYNHFPSKDDLVAAYLRRREDRWRADADGILGIEDPDARLAAYVRRYVAETDDATYRGCAMLNAAAELGDDHPALAVVAASKQRTVEDLAGMLGALGAAAPREVAHTAALLLEGGCSRAGALREPPEVEAIVAAVTTLVR